ncbi:uncharacterized protein A1O9_11692 [Exophiala aquamarina CBS 119918]|uniref:Uncharacterized protein n=1 Tax=Exophiala aquamarina CBS 119918 TaxID=1182545 RepID=A0A072NXW4_9EURO|nr:uncharacterized protein A1O9_11692 [Exophiala aquamarina CBS 119918]KEF52451.1 hypothetical protein A1O9_11692 [Exophiala aquamarina CBS 119918]
MAADKVPILTQTALASDGWITSADSDLASGAQAHYHADFSESFPLISGEMTVYTSTDLDELNLVAQKYRSRNKGCYSTKYPSQFIIPKEHTKVKAEYSTGSLGFEKTFLIMKGMQDDGIYEEFSSS